MTNEEKIILLLERIADKLDSIAENTTPKVIASKPPEVTVYPDWQDSIVRKGEGTQL